MKTRRLIIIFSILAFILVVVILGSAVFTVRSVNADCFNYNDPALDQSVAAVGSRMEGRNIFLMSPSRYIPQIENTGYSSGGQATGVRVINIERKFPDRIWIHFIKVIPIFAFAQADASGPTGTYVTADNGLTVCAVGADGSQFNFSATIDDFNADPVGVLIPITLPAGDTAASPAVNMPLKIAAANGAADTAVMGVFSQFVNAMNRMQYFEYNFLRAVGAIDFSQIGGGLNELDVAMRQSAGAGSINFRIWDSGSLLTDKIQLAMSLYNGYIDGTIPTLPGTTTIYQNSDGQLQAAAPGNN